MYLDKNIFIKIKFYFKKIIPAIMIESRRKIYWKGDYKKFDLCLKDSRGYNSDQVLLSVKSSALKVATGIYPYERDGVLFEKIEYSFGLLSSLFYIGLNEDEINLIDFGGGLGSSFYQNKLLTSYYKVNWRVVEQPHFVDNGIKELSNENLSFHYNILDAKTEFTKAILLSSVIQYLDSPWGFIDEVISYNFKYIIIDRTSFNLLKSNDRIALQVTDPSIQDSSYPCWFLDEKKFLKKILQRYSLKFEWPGSDSANIPSYFKGFLFELKYE